jgi:hypothetical protein
MKLDTEFIKLPLLFDVERLKVELAQFSEEDWLPHATGYTGNSSIPLISLNGEYNDALHGPMQATSALDRCNYIRQVMTEFDEVFSRSRLMRLDPGTEVPPHVDVNYHWHNRVRIHIPITTTDDVLFYCNDKNVHMAAGECWIFDSWSEHTVKNDSDKTRVHLVLDTAGSPRFWHLAEQGVWPFMERLQPASKPKTIHYDPKKEAHIRTETYNAPLVLSPGEIENLTAILIDDASLSPESDEERLDQYKWITKSFVRAWREVWSEHGMKPSGWPLYHNLVRAVDAAISTVSPDLILSSNEVELGPAFRGLVLYSAINEEFAPQYLDKDELPDDLKLATRYFSNDNAGSKNSSDSEAEHIEIVSSMKSAENNEFGRNRPCSCGSGLRYKHCHGKIT